MADETRSGPETPAPAPATASAGSRAAFVALKSGLAIRHYIIEEVIGAGGFGITYRARHDTLKAKVFALKEFFPREFAQRSGTHVVSTPEGQGLFHWGLDRFLMEAEALAKCEHPSIVDVVDFFRANGTAYAVLAYVEGQQLGDWLNGLGRPPTQAELDRILMPLLGALEVVHEAKLLHRDIAPDNILIDRRGDPVLIDFGACREDIRERSRKVSAIVKHGYSPPEQYHGIAELQGPWTDLYSMGATLYRAISGAPPMDSSRRGALGDFLKPISEMTQEPYRAGFMQAIDMSLRLKPEERPRSVADWREMLMAGDGTAGDQSLLPPRNKEGTSGGAGDGRRGSRTQRIDGAGGTSPSAGGSKHGKSRVGDDGAEGGARSDSAHPEGRSDGADKRQRLPSPSRLGPLAVAAAAALFVGGMTALAVWRSPSPPIIPDPKPGPVGPSKEELPDRPKPSAEQAAAEAWSRIAGTADIASIEGFLATHGKAQSAAPARERLRVLREEQRNAEGRQASERREQAAAAAWARIAQGSDSAAIERFLREHGSSRLAETARARLSALGLAAARQRELEVQWQDCRNAAEDRKEAACTAVIESEDTAARRAEALHARGLVFRKGGDLDRAIADFTRSLELAPARASALNDRGIAQFLKGDKASRDAALRDYDAAISHDPRHAEALNNRAWAHFQAGHAAVGLPDANRSIEIQPTNGYAYDTRGQILEALGRREEAIRDYERALAIDGSQETSRAGLARLRPARR